MRVQVLQLRTVGLNYQTGHIRLTMFVCLAARAPRECCGAPSGVRHAVLAPRGRESARDLSSHGDEEAAISLEAAVNSRVLSPGLASKRQFGTAVRTATGAHNRSHARPQTPLATCRGRPDLGRAGSLHPDGYLSAVHSACHSEPA